MVGGWNGPGGGAGYERSDGLTSNTIACVCVRQLRVSRGTRGLSSVCVECGLRKHSRVNTKRNEKLLLQPNPEERSQVNPQTKLITSPAYIYRSRPRAPRRGGVIQPLPRTPPSTPNKTHYPCHGRPCRAAPRRATRAAPCVTHAEYTRRALLSDRRPHLCGGQRLQQWRVFSDGHRLLGRRWGEGGRELSDR